MEDCTIACQLLTLYIPIWFYFNGDTIKSIAKAQLFAFQYGSTLITWPFPKTVVAVIFTFQYGSTLICKKCNNAIPYLLYIPIWFYFNCKLREETSWDGSLYIPIWFYFNKFRRKLGWIVFLFTFQYGSTLMGSLHLFCCELSFLYIPIWFYFNP